MTAKRLLAIAALTFVSAIPAHASEGQGWNRTVRVADHLEPALPHP